jgi:hypothetical protein
MAEMDRSDVELYRGLESKLGPDVATALMERLPAVPRDQQVTLAHLDARFAEVDARFAAVDARFAVVDARFDAVDARFDHLEERVDLKLDALRHELTAVFRRELSSEIGGLRGEMIHGFHSQTRAMVLTMVGSLVGLAGLAAALAPFV